MAKGSGGTKSSSSSAPKGQGAASKNLQAAQTVGRGSEAYEKSMLEYVSLKKDLAGQSKQSGWNIVGISRVTAEKEIPEAAAVRSIRVQLKTEKGENFFTAGVWKLRNIDKPGYTNAKQALYRRFDSKKFKTPTEAIAFAEKEAEKFNKKWK